MFIEDHKRSRKDQQKFSTLLKKVAVSKHVKVDEILDDYYALDFEDLVAFSFYLTKNMLF
jgi:uncharacterized protein (DUF433 family)